MEDRFSKYFHLSFNLLFTFLAFVGALLVLMLGMKYAFRLLDYIPWFVYLFIIFILLVPATLFATVFTIYYKRTGSYPVAWVKWLSRGIFVIALCFALLAFVISTSDTVCPLTVCRPFPFDLLIPTSLDGGEELGTTSVSCSITEVLLLLPTLISSESRGRTSALGMITLLLSCFRLTGVMRCL
ncbi:MAG: hypothetical protein EOO03_04580, partial [Chitinophagaceae bacterium]